MAETRGSDSTPDEGRDEAAKPESGAPTGTGGAAESGTPAESSTPAGSSTPAESSTPAGDDLMAGPGHGGRQQRWWPWLVPAVTFAIGVALGAVVVAVGNSGGSGSSDMAAPGGSGVPTPVATSTTPHPPATITVPGKCLQVADDSQQLLDLASQAATAARDLDASRLSDVVAKMGVVQSTLRTNAEACKSISSQSGTN